MAARLKFGRRARHRGRDSRAEDQFFLRPFSWQLPLTFMFLSAKIGDLAAAQAELETYARTHELAEDNVAKLAKLLRDLAAVENGRSQS